MVDCRKLGEFAPRELKICASVWIAGPIQCFQCFRRCIRHARLQAEKAPNERETFDDETQCDWSLKLNKNIDYILRR